MTSSDVTPKGAFQWKKEKSQLRTKSQTFCKLKCRTSIAVRQIAISVLKSHKEVGTFQSETNTRVSILMLPQFFADVFKRPCVETDHRGFRSAFRRSRIQTELFMARWAEPVPRQKRNCWMWGNRLFQFYHFLKLLLLLSDVSKENLWLSCRYNAMVDQIFRPVLRAKLVLWLYGVYL